MPSDLEGSHYPARWWHMQADGRVRCDLCPRDCTLKEGQRGLCFVRGRAGDRMVLTTWGRTSGLCVDPVEKKPLHHFLPGTSVVSFGTAGCNLACKFCQNWDMSKSREMDTIAESAPPARIAELALRVGAPSVAFTYNDPVPFAEYAIDVADACHAKGLFTIAVTAGYVHPEPRVELFSKMDAANVDLKAFTEDFYRDLTAGHLEPVKDTLRYLVHETRVWTEITTLLIPGHNDTDEEITKLARFVAKELSPDVPLHFSAFHPDYLMRDTPPTPPATLTRARRLAIAEGLRYVYTGNVHDLDGDRTACASCGETLIQRDWYEILDYRLTGDGACPACGAVLPGRFGARAGTFGRRRMPLHLELVKEQSKEQSKEPTRDRPASRAPGSRPPEGPSAEARG